MEFWDFPVFSNAAGGNLINPILSIRRCFPNLQIRLRIVPGTRLFSTLTKLFSLHPHFLLRACVSFAYCSGSVHNLHTYIMNTALVKHWETKLSQAQAELETYSAWSVLIPVRTSLIALASRDMFQARNELSKLERAEAAREAAEAFASLPWYKRLFRSV